MNIIKGEVKGPVLNNAHVTYFCYTADSISFIQAGKDPVVLGLSTLHLSFSIFNCFLLLHECLFYVHCSICSEAQWRSSIILLPSKAVMFNEKTTLIKHIISAFMKRFFAKWTSFFHVFPQVLTAAQSEQCQYYVSCWAQKKESWGLWQKQQKVADEEIDVLCWCSPLKVITETDSHGSLKILEAKLRIHCWYLVIITAFYNRM